MRRHAPALAALFIALFCCSAGAQTIYVVDRSTDAVKRYSLDGTSEGIFAQDASAGGTMWHGFTCSPSGNLLVSRNQANDVAELDGSTGEFIRVFANQDVRYPYGIVFGANGNLFVGNEGSDRVNEYDGTTGSFVRTFATCPGQGQPMGLTFGPNGNLFVACSVRYSESGVFQFDGTTGELVGKFSSEPYSRGVAFGSNGNLYVSNTWPQYYVDELNGTTGATLRTFGGLYYPHGLAFTHEGNLLVTEAHGGDIVEVNLTTGARKVVASGGGFLLDIMIGDENGPCGPRRVTVDIKPGSFPNPINSRSQGVVPVAVLTTPRFDATTLDSSTVRFGALGTEAAPSKAEFADVDGDGHADALFHFRTQETLLACGMTEATLKARTVTGQAVGGSDAIKTVGCAK